MTLSPSRRMALVALAQDPQRCDDVCAQLDTIRAELEGMRRSYGVDRGNKTYGYDYNRGLASRYTGRDPYHGGLQASGVVQVPGNYGGGTVTFNWSPAALARLGGTELCRLYCTVAPVPGATAQPVVDLAAAGNVTLFHNGIPVVGCIDVNFATLLPTLNGTPQAAGLSEYLRPADTIEVRLTLPALGGLAADGSSIVWVVDGGDCRDC